MSRPVVLVDGLNIFTRHFVANPTMSSDGTHVGGLVGFLKNIRYLCEKFNPESVCIAWEGGGSVRRRAVRRNYKDNRRPTKLNRFYEDIPDTYENRDNQLMSLIEFLKHMPVIQIYVPDCEGDDIIAHMANNTFRSKKCMIISSDKDLYQCISERVSQWSPGRKKLMTPAAVLEEFGVLASNFALTRAFVGDSSDGIVGVKGAGFKTMAKRFPILSSQEDVMLSDIFENAKTNNVKRSPAIYSRILEEQSLIKDNMKLMTLEGKNLSATQALKVDSIVDSHEFTPNKLNLFRLFMRREIKNFDIDALWVSLKCLTTPSVEGK